MRIRSFPALLGLGLSIVALLLVGLPAGGTQVVPLTFEETVRRAGTMVAGTVSGKQSRWGDASRRWMVTDYTIAVDDVLYGEVGDSIVITYWGGTIDGETQRIAGIRLPVAGESLIVMLRPDWREQIGFTPTVGLDQGMFAVRDDQVVDAAGRPLALTAGGSIVRESELERGVSAPPVTLASFSAWMRDNIKRIKSTPPTPDTPAASPNTLPLFSKTPALPESATPQGAIPPAEDTGTVAVPDAPPAGRIPHAPTPTNAIAAPRNTRPRIGANYSSFGQAYPPIVINSFPASFSPWMPEDQYQMSKWNHYANNIFRVYTTPTGTFAWPDGIFDLDGWPSSATLAAVYGTGWGSGTIGVTFYRFDGFGRIIEADIALNPAFGFTLDDEWIYDGSSAQSFRHVMLHELGHMHGLDHNFSYLSVMNYFPSVFRMFALPYADDAEGIRAEYPGSAISRTDLGAYLYYSSGFQSVSDATYPFSVTAGTSLFVNDYHVENVGTTTISTPTIQWYLSPVRNFGSSYYYLDTTTYPSLPRFNYFTPSTVGRTLNVPASVPTGSYYLAAYIPNDSGAGQSSFPFSNDTAFSRYTIFVQGAPTCSSFSISPSSANPSAAAGSQGVTITGSPSGCQSGSWSTSGNGSWITVSPSSGSGSGSATVSWGQNTSTSARSGNATIAGWTFSVNQAGAQPPVCTSFQINLSSVSPGSAAGSQGVTVSGLPAGCQGGAWSASGNGSWITVSPVSGSGSGGVTVFWSQNSSASSRSGSATIAGNAFNVNQSGTGAAPRVRFDVNADARADLFWRNGSTGETSFWFMNGVAGPGTVRATTVPSSWTPSLIGDFDGDGRADLWWRNASTGQTSAWLGWNGTGFSTQVFSLTVSTAWVPAGSGDFNADGKTDIFWRNASTGQTSIWFMNGSMYSSTALTTTVPMPWTPGPVGDFDGDGRADVFWRNPSTGQTSIWLGWNGAAFTTQVFSLTVPTAWAPVAAGDMNGGGNADLFWYNASTGETSIWFMSGAVVSSSVRSTTVPTSWRPSSAGDYDGDGTTDLFWRNAATGETSLWLGCNGSGWNTQVRSLTVPTTWAPFASQ